MTHAIARGGRRGPLAVKVPEITFLFWIIKLLTTAGGEATSDYLALHGYLLAAVVEGAIFVIAVIIQFSVRRYVAVAYWFLALSIPSIPPPRRELFYWATVFATFALGTALGDFTAAVLHLGYLGSAVLFFVVILIPAVAWRLGMNAIAAFWWAYVVTRPLGASFADWFSKPHNLSGLNYGDGPTAAVMLALIVILVGYTAIARYDIQRPSAAT